MESSALKDFLAIGIGCTPIAFILYRELLWIIRALIAIHRKEDDGLGTAGFIGALFMLGVLGIMAVGYYDYSRYGNAGSNLATVTLLAAPVYLIGEILLQVNRSRKSDCKRSD